MLRLKAWQTAILVLLGALFLGVTPMTLYNATLLMLGNSCGVAWKAVRAVPVPTPPLKAAILNVTSDFDQLAHLVIEFLQQPGMDPAIQEQFKEFLSHRATRSYPRLESTLDWLLAIYKFVFPFLIISMVAKLSSQGSGGEQQEQQQFMTPAGSAGLLPTDSSRAVLLQAPLEGSSGQYSGLGRHRSGSRQLDALAPALPSGSGDYGQQRRPLALHSSRSVKAKTGGSSGMAAAGRAGSQSPRGPETPMEGGRLPPHPALLAPAGPAVYEHHHHPASEISVGGS